MIVKLKCHVRITKGAKDAKSLAPSFEHRRMGKISSEGERYNERKHEMCARIGNCNK